MDPILGLQNAMREAEADLAQRAADEGGLDLLVLDGPLTYFAPAAPVVGMIKRQVRPISRRTTRPFFPDSGRANGRLFF